MVSAILIALMSLAGVAITGLVTWAIAHRKSSGTVKTTDADTLWTQVNDLLNRYKLEVVEARAEVQTLRAEVVLLRSELEKARNLLTESKEQ